MSDFSEPNYRVTTLTQPPQEDCGGGTSWLWAVLFLIALAIIIGLGIWIAFLYHNRTKDKGKTIDFKNPKIELAGDTSIKGSWDATNDANDVVILYATTEPPEFTTDGGLSNPSSQVKSQQAATNTSSVTLTGLQPRIKYYATLIATNKETSNYQVYTQLVYMSSATPARLIANNNNNLTNNTFSIQDILQVGKLEAPEITASSSGPYTVIFNQAPAEPRSLWYINSNGQIQLDETGTGLENLCLTKKTDNTLAVDTCGTTGNIAADTTWIYQNNKWCLQTTTNTDNPTCMVLGDISTTTGKAPVTLSSSSKPGDAWVNAFENP